jgi:hypothetical protein
MQRREGVSIIDIAHRTSRIALATAATPPRLGQVIRACRRLPVKPLYWVTDRLITLRVPIEQDALGLDISQHNEFLELDPFRQFGGLAQADSPLDPAPGAKR